MSDGCAISSFGKTGKSGRNRVRCGGTQRIKEKRGSGGVAVNILGMPWPLPV